MALLWGKTETMALIQLYHAKSCLWKVTEVDYRNQSKRKSALEDIALKMQTVRPGTTAKEVQTKINGLRTQFSEQLRKQRKRCGSTDPYTKVLWCFESLQFLRDSVVPRPVTSNDCPTDQDDAARETSEQDDEEDGDDGDDDLVEESTEPWTCVDVNVTSPNCQQIQMPPPSRRKRKAENSTFYDTVIASMLRIAEMSTKSAATVSAAASSATNNNSSSTGVGVSTAVASTSTAVIGDNYAVFGAYIAGELRSLRDPVQQHLAQMDIQRVIFKRKCAVLRIPHHSKSDQWTSSSTDGDHNRLGDCCSVNCSPGEEYDVDEADDDDDCDDPVK